VLSRKAHADRLVRPLIVEGLDEAIELGLLLQECATFNIRGTTSCARLTVAFATPHLNSFRLIEFRWPRRIVEPLNIIAGTPSVPESQRVR
jgi:hypothetical protein